MVDLPSRLQPALTLWSNTRCVVACKPLAGPSPSTLTPTNPAHDTGGLEPNVYPGNRPGLQIAASYDQTAATYVRGRSWV